MYIPTKALIIVDNKSYPKDTPHVWHSLKIAKLTKKTIGFVLAGPSCGEWICIFSLLSSLATVVSRSLLHVSFHVFMLYSWHVDFTFVRWLSYSSLHLQCFIEILLQGKINLKFYPHRRSYLVKLANLLCVFLSI